MNNAKNTWLTGEKLPSEEWLHAIELVPENFLAIWNVPLFRGICSPGFLVSLDPNLQAAHLSFRNLPLEQLLSGQIAGGALPPRVAKYSMVGYIDRLGQNARMGDKLINPEIQKKRRKVADLEIEFERYRREVNLSAASRLDCVWVTEANDRGRSTTESIFKGAHFILKTSIDPFFRVTRADSRWVDKFFEEWNSDFIKKYWQGEPESENPLWEYLVDGRINFKDSDIQELIAKALLVGAWPKEVALPDWVIKERDKAFAK